MAIRFYNPYTPGNRNHSALDFSELTRKQPEKHLVKGQNRSHGRNNRGVITCRHKGGGHKRLYRTIDFRRGLVETPAKVEAIEYDPNRTANLALLHYEDGTKSYILHPRGVKVGDTLLSSLRPPIQSGNALPLASAPLGTLVHAIELQPGKGAQVARSAGSAAQIVAKEGAAVTLRLPSGEVRLFSRYCWSTIGQVGNEERANIRLGKAGRRRWLGIRPRVRGVVMNPVDHPHGGGEGRAPIGRSRPVTPWGQPALGKRTRSNRRYSEKAILRRRGS